MHSGIQVVVNFSSSSGPAEEVASAIQRSGGDAITLKADISKPEEVQRCVFSLTSTPAPPMQGRLLCIRVKPAASKPAVHAGDHNVCCEFGWAAPHASAYQPMSAACDLVIRQSGLSRPCVYMTG